MPTIYSLSLKHCLNISDIQFDFLESVATNKGDIEKALELQPVSQEIKDGWKKDEDFWSSVTAVSNQLAMARTLNLAYVKDQLLATIEGQKQPNKMQMAAINASIRLLQAGSAGIRSAKMEVTPDSFKVSFEESEMKSEPLPGDPDSDQDCGISQP
jgi:hypothetical protein